MERPSAPTRLMSAGDRVDPKFSIDRSDFNGAAQVILILFKT